MPANMRSSAPIEPNGAWEGGHQPCQLFALLHQPACPIMVVVMVDQVAEPHVGDDNIVPTTAQCFNKLFIIYCIDTFR
jgi:hypothetical protein